MKINASELHTLQSLLWIVTHDEEAFKKVLGAFNASRDDQQTQVQFLENLQKLLVKTSNQG